MSQSPSSVWNNCLTFIKDNIQPQAYKTWFEPIKPIKYENNVLSVQVPSKFFYEWLEEHYVKLLKLALNKKKISFPVVVKPVNEGSSLGVKISKNLAQLSISAKLLFKKYEQLMFEKYIGGQEIQVAVINNVPIGAIELGSILFKALRNLSSCSWKTLN